MADDIVERLGCAYRHGTTGCGLCTFCLARAEIERLRARNAELLAQRQTPRRPDITVDVGVGTAIDIIRDINCHLDNIEAMIHRRKDRHEQTEP